MPRRLFLALAISAAATLAGGPALTSSPAMAADAPSYRAFHIAGTSHLHGVACGTESECAAVGWAEGPSAVAVTFVNGDPGDVQGIGPGQLWGVACGSDVDCVAVGGDYNSFAERVPLHAGVVGAAESVAGSGMLYGADCPTATSCVLVGECIQSGACQGTVVGNARVQSVAGSTRFYRVSCVTATDCLAVGAMGPGPDHAGVVVHVTNGVAGGALSVPGLEALDGVACMTETSCLAVGEDYPPQHGVLVQISQGTPGGPRAVAGMFPSAVSCPSDTTCVVAGRETNPADGAFAVVTDGAPGAVHAVPEASQLEDIVCPTASHCVAVGFDAHSSTGVIVEIDLGPGSEPAAGEPTAGDLVDDLLDLFPPVVIVLGAFAFLFGLLLIVRAIYNRSSSS